VATKAILHAELLANFESPAIGRKACFDIIRVYARNPAFAELLFHR
jgi:hypothetical protein